MRYHDCPLDRADHLRQHRDRLRELLQQPEARILALQQGGIHVDRQHSRLATHHRDDCDASIQLDDDTLIFLGLEAETPWFLLRLDACEPNARFAAEAFLELRQIGPLLSPDEAAIAAYARAMDQWHRECRFCQRCAAALISEKAGHQKRCSNRDCDTVTFPRIDPAVIMLIVHGEGDQERCLLGRNARFPPGVFSTLAGFVELGETLEQAVMREAFEEAGIHVTEPRYLASQPWPFPRSIMLGFTARARDTKLNIDNDELVEARWFSRSELDQFGEWGDGSEWQLPRGDSIARLLLQRWREQR